MFWTKKKTVLYIFLIFVFCIISFNLKSNRKEFTSNVIKLINNNKTFQIAQINAPKLPEFYPQLFGADIFTYANRKNSSLMPRSLNENEYELYMETIEKTLKLLGTHKIEYMMFYGTLLGSLRHWDIVPWDDDFVSFSLTK